MCDFACDCQELQPELPVQSLPTLSMRRLCVRSRDGRKFATQADLEESIEVVIAGYQKKERVFFPIRRS